MIAVALTAGVSAQSGGKPTSGNPTPGTPQPDPPNLADRITLTGCVQASPERPGGAVNPNTPYNTRFVLAGAERQSAVPAGTGGSETAARASGRTYRLEAIESQLSPFVGTKVQISGEVKQTTSASVRPPVASILLVEFVQKIAGSCS